MNHQQFGDHRQQFGGPSPFHNSPEEQDQRQPRNSMKRARGYSPPAFYSPSDPQSTYPAAKRVRRVSGTESFGFPNNNFNNNVNNRGPFPASKSDDEVSLAEEVHTAPTVLPNHSIFAQKQQNKQYQQPAQIHSQHHQSQLGYQQAVASGNTTQFPHGNGPLGANRASYATDYQPMNNLLGNLHLMRQQRRQNNAQSSQMQTQIRQLSPVIPMQQPHQQQHQHQQNHYQRQYGNYHSVSKPATSNNGSGKNRSQKKKVSLRVSSNLF